MTDTLQQATDESTPEQRREAFRLAEELIEQQDALTAADLAEQRRAEAERKRAAAVVESEAKRWEAFNALSLARALEAEIETLERADPRVSTGWGRLDAALGGGFEVPSLNVLGAAPKSGKSTWAQIVAERFAQAPHGGIVYYLDLENGRRRFLRRMIGRRAGVGYSVVARALAGNASLPDRKAVEAWQAAKAWIFDVLGTRLFVDSTPPEDFADRVARARLKAGKGTPLLVVVDSLQKLPMRLDERRADVDRWLRMFERLRIEHDAIFLVISEIARAGEGGFKRGLTAFKESGGIEYAADLAMTFVKDDADDPRAPSVLAIEAARESDDDARGPIATYRPIFPHYGIEEGPPTAPMRKGEQQALGGGPRRHLPPEDE